MPEQKSTPRSHAEWVNNFLNGKKQVTDTDAALAIAYYPLLVGLATRLQMITFKEFLDLAKATYPDNPAVQNAIPVSTGRRLEFVRIFTALQGLPDPSAWVTGRNGKNSSTFEKDFDPVKERRESAEVDWPLHQAAGEAHAALLRKKAQHLKPRSLSEASAMMAKIAHEIRPRIEAAIPNPNKRPYAQLVGPYRETILQDLMSGLDPQDMFENVLIDMRNDQLDQSEHEG
jgi:hypothetical protein